MANDRLLLSVVCPAFEEEEVLACFHLALANALRTLHETFVIEIIYVDDGSRDRTFEVIRELAANDQRVRGISLSRNFGHQAALTAGLESARGDAVVMLDSDLQHPPTLIPRLIAQWQAGYDVVQTVRDDDGNSSWFKRLSSRVFYKVLRRLSELEVRPAAADFRLLSRRALDSLLRMNESHRYLRGMVQWLGFRVAEVSFRPDVRRAGVTKYTLRKMLRLAFDGLYSFSRAPLRLGVSVGLSMTALSLFATLGLTLTKGGGFWIAAVLIAAHAMVGSLFAVLGAIGEYVSRTYDECKKRPLYVIQQEIPARTNQRLAA
jgi:dolichol-phosphate mannosyltransferase